MNDPLEAPILELPEYATQEGWKIKVGTMKQAFIVGDLLPDDEIGNRFAIAITDRTEANTMRQLVKAFKLAPKRS